MYDNDMTNYGDEAAVIILQNDNLKDGQRSRNDQHAWLTPLFFNTTPSKTKVKAAGST